MHAPRPLRGPAWRAILALVVAGGVAGALGGELTDLLVYRYGGRAVVDGVSAYAGDDPLTGLPFTYPPFAAVLMVPLAPLPTWLAAALWTGASAGALAGSVVVVRRALGRTSPDRLVILVGVAALAVEPVWQSLTFGQVNLLLMLAVLVDLLRPERRLSGVVLGIAAGVKLTPLVFVVLLVLAGHRAAAGRAVLAFGSTVAIGFAAMPGSAAYWTDRLLDPSRVGPPALAHNQSVYGALTRLLDSAPSTHLWLVASGPLAVAVVVVAAVWWRRGDRMLGTCLGAVAMLLASPVAWSHHWVWAVPIALVLWERNRWAAAAWTAVFVTRPILWPPWGEGREFEWGALEHLAGNAYLLAALVFAAWASIGLLRSMSHPRPDRCLHVVTADRPVGTATGTATDRGADMQHTTRIPPAEITGAKGALVKRMAAKKLGKVPTAVGVYWHNPKVLFATFGLGGKVQKWDACDEGLKSFAHMAVASLVGCTWCLDFNYFEAHNLGLDLEKAREIPRWRESGVFTPLERDVLEYAEAMSQTPPTVTDELVERLHAELGPAAVVELTSVIAFANLTTRGNVALGIESDGFAAACGLKPLAERPAVPSPS